MDMKRLCNIKNISIGLVCFGVKVALGVELPVLPEYTEFFHMPIYLKYEIKIDTHNDKEITQALEVKLSGVEFSNEAHKSRYHTESWYATNGKEFVFQSRRTNAPENVEDNIFYIGTENFYMLSESKKKESIISDKPIKTSEPLWIKYLTHFPVFDEEDTWVPLNDIFKSGEVIDVSDENNADEKTFIVRKFSGGSDRKKFYSNYKISFFVTENEDLLLNEIILYSIVEKEGSPAYELPAGMIVKYSDYGNFEKIKIALPKKIEISRYVIIDNVKYSPNPYDQFLFSTENVILTEIIVGAKLELQKEVFHK